jgi:hypothetical protein
MPAVAALTTCLTRALDKTGANEDFARLTPDGRLLVLAAAFSYGRELLLTGEEAADHAERLITAITGCPRLGAAVRLAVRKWARAD